jgi:hypothetical protein
MCRNGSGHHLSSLTGRSRKQHNSKPRTDIADVTVANHVNKLTVTFD